MPIRVVVYGLEGDGQAFSAAAQIRALIAEMCLDASVQIVTDPMQHEMNGIENMPTVTIDSITICQGYSPSRREIQGALEQRVSQTSFTPDSPG